MRQADAHPTAAAAAAAGNHADLLHNSGRHLYQHGHDARPRPGPLCRPTMAQAQPPHMTGGAGTNTSMDTKVGGMQASASHKYGSARCTSTEASRDRGTRAYRRCVLKCLPGARTCTEACRPHACTQRVPTTCKTLMAQPGCRQGAPSPASVLSR